MQTIQIILFIYLFSVLISFLFLEQIKQGEIVRDEDFDENAVRAWFIFTPVLNTFVALIYIFSFLIFKIYKKK